MKLHEAIEKVLIDNRRPMSAVEIASAINYQKLYSRGDGSPVPSSQIHARVKNYSSLYSKVGSKIQLAHVQRDCSLKSKTNKPEYDLFNNDLFISNQEELTLHEAIDHVLKKRNTPMEAKDIAEEINKAGLYSRKDGTPIPASQIHLRVNHYPHLFTKLNDGTISRITNEVHDLSAIAAKMQQNIRNMFVHEEITFGHFHLLVPMLFFFKRMVDSPELMKKYLGLPLNNQQFNLDGMKQFFVDLNEGSASFKGKLHDMIEEISFLTELTNEEKLISDLKSVILSNEKIEACKFGEFFNNLIYTASKQEAKSGQFFTPKILGNLFYGLSENSVTNNLKIYNPAAGFSTIPALFAQKSNMNFHFAGEEIDGYIYLLSVMNLISSGVEVDNFLNEDSLIASNDKDLYDLVICVPPFTGTYSNPLFQQDHPIQTTDLPLLFLQHSILRLNKNGKAFILVPENVLFSLKNDSKDVRKYLLANKLLECVISLPAGILNPLTGIKTSLLIISNKQNNEVLFIDAQSGDLPLVHSNSETVLDVSKICNLYHNQESESIYFHEDNPAYGKVQRSIVPINNIDSEYYQLNANRYLIVNDQGGSGKQELGTFLQEYKGQNSTSDDNLKFVNITDLNSNYHDIHLNLSKLRLIEKSSSARIVNAPVMLVSSLAPRLKPTYYNQSQEPIYVSRNIYTFTVDEQIIDIEYLIYELNTEAVMRFVESRSTGATTLNRIRISDLLKMRIKVPPLAEQKDVVRNLKERLFSKEITGAQNSSEETTLTAKSEKEILGFVKHEIGNITGGINRDIINLKDFIVHNSIDLNEKIVPRHKASSLDEVFNRMQTNIQDIENVMSNIQRILDYGDSFPNKKLISFREFVSSEYIKTKNILNNKNIKVLIAVNEDYGDEADENILLDESQFSVVIRNFIVNADKHGFVHAGLDNTIVFNLNIDEDFYYLNMINNGAPFPEGFSLQNYLSFGGRVKTTEGSGLGGFLIGKVVENHMGTIEMMTPGTALFLDSPNASGFINNNFLKVGVHLLIKLPKE